MLRRADILRPELPRPEIVVMPAYATDRVWTVEEVLALPPDRNRYEVVHGELLVTPSPNVRHQIVLGRVMYGVQSYLDRIGMQGFMPGPVDFFHGTEVYVQPDCVVAYFEELTESYRTMRHLRLVVEVISPSSARGDRLVKRAAYQAAGVETYWVIDPDRSVVEIWHPEDQFAEIATKELVWRATPDAPEMVLDLGPVFAPVPKVFSSPPWGNPDG